jgi:GMP synthase (glutamine-hydrolysing)
VSRSAGSSLVILVTGDPVPAAEARHGGFAQMIQRRARGAWPGSWRVVDARRGETAELAPGRVAGLVITGSPASLVDREPWMAEAEDTIRRAVDAGLPTLGICFGHQLLATALGGRVERNPYGREIGTVELQVGGDHPWLPRAGGRVNTTHLDSIVELPPGARGLATTEREPCAAVRFTENVLGVQFHPEIDAPVMRLYIEARQEPMRAEGLDPDAILEAVDDGMAGADVLARFCAAAARRV